jgi:mono/diheme cytochrome c family protein
MRRIMASSIVVLGSAALYAAVVRADGQAQAASQWSPELGLVMTHHYTDVSAIHEAVVRGDLADVHARARRLFAMTDPPETPPVTTHVAEIRWQGTRAAVARNLDEAASAAAAMVTECGACHASRGVRPSPPERRAPSIGGIVGHMVDHQRAVDALLLGLVVPSSSEWTRGAELLKAPLLKGVDLPPDPELVARAMVTERQIHGLADVLLAATTREARVVAYSRVIATCANCHSLHPAIWGPGQGVRAAGPGGR